MDDKSENAAPADAIEIATLVDMTRLAYRNPVWANFAHTSMTLEVQWPPSTAWTPYSTASFDPWPDGAAFFARVVAETGEENIGEYVPPPPAPYTLQVSDFWDRMTEQEGEDFDAAMATASPLKSRKAFNAAQSLQSESDLFAWVKNVLKGVTTAARADAIMAQ